MQTSFEELNALCDSLDVVVAKELHQTGQILDANLAYSPNLIALELLKCAFEHLGDKDVV